MQMFAEKILLLLESKNFDTLISMYPIATATYEKVRFQLTGYTKKLSHDFDYKNYHLDCWKVESGNPHGEFLKSIDVSNYAHSALSQMVIVNQINGVPPLLLLAKIFENSDFFSSHPLSGVLMTAFQKMRATVEQETLNESAQAPIGVIAGKRKAL